jgi:mono/diheme cytochrome c family protein
VRRLLLLLAPLALGVLLAGCGSGTVASPTAKTVVGSLPTTTAAPEGDPEAGKALFTQQGCTGCHTFTPAGSKASVGPDLDKLEADAEKANRGSVEEYTRESIVNPAAYVVPSFPAGVMPAYNSLSAKQVSDLVAFLTKSGS